MGAKDSALIGAAGEHYILYRLQRRNLLASLAPTNAYAADILVFSPAMAVGSLVQVKTRTGRHGGWPMGEKHEMLAHERLFYAFLDLEPREPETFIVPCRVVQEVLQVSHQTWLAIPSLRGQPHRDNPMRQIRSSYPFPVPGYPDGWLESYRERWDYLERDPTRPDPEG